MCFAVFCGVLRFAGVLRVFCSVLRVLLKKQCFAVFCGCFAMFWTCFANVFCRHFLSERKMHSTVLRCIAQSTKHILFVFCILYTLFWSVLCCFWKLLRMRGAEAPGERRGSGNELEIRGRGGGGEWAPNRARKTKQGRGHGDGGVGR